MGPSHIKDPQVVVVAPAKPLPQIQRVRLAGRVAVAGQETSNSLPHRKRIKVRRHQRRDKGGLCDCHHWFLPLARERTDLHPTKSTRSSSDAGSREIVVCGCLNEWVEGEEMVKTRDRLRFDVPLYTVTEAARIVDVPVSTLSTWAQGYVRRFPKRSAVFGDPIITYLQPDGPRRPSIPFVGLTEATVLAAIRSSGVPMQRIRPAVQALKAGLGVDHALASRRLYTDGAELLFDYAESHQDTADGQAAKHLVVIRSGQRVFTDVILEYLRRIEYASDGYAELIHVPAYEHAQVVVDPTRSFGAPIFERGGSRLDDVLQRFWAGESLDGLSNEFGVPPSHLEDVLRVTSRRAA